MVVKLETERLILINYSENDLDSIYKLKSEPLIWRFSDKEATKDIEEAKKHLENVLKNYSLDKYDFQALFIKDTQEYIGEAGVLSFNKEHSRAVIGYNLLPKYWGNGYATEITKALVRYLFEQLNIERVEALVCDDNEASKKVLEKSGLLHEGRLRNFAFINNMYVNVCYYGMIRKDYFRLQSS